MGDFDLGRHRRIHLVGIGGIGVSAVARLLLARGFIVSGSDIRESKITRALEAEGARVFIGHSAQNIGDADLVVYSTAIPQDNIEIRAAKERGCKVVHRSQVLSALMRGYKGIGVTGTNGKGTVSALITWFLSAEDLDPSFAIGAILNNFGTNARQGRGPHLVCELDESDGSFTNTSPERLVIVNLEADHLNYYKDLQGVIRTFGQYLASDKAPGIVHVNGDDPNIREVLRISGYPAQRVITFGFGEANSYRVVDFEMASGLATFRVVSKEGDLGLFSSPLPGRYNALNVVAALSVALQEGVRPQQAKEKLRHFLGLENRFTVVEAGPLRLVKDYISHPTGVRAVIEAAKDLWGTRVIAVFKPYRYTMIHYLQNEYAVAFRDAELVIITKMFEAGEEPIPGVDTEFLVRKVREGGNRVLYCPEMDAIEEVLREVCRPKDTVIFFGGDDLFQVADRFAKALARGS